LIPAILYSTLQIEGVNYLRRWDRYSKEIGYGKQANEQGCCDHPGPSDKRSGAASMNLGHLIDYSEIPENSVALHIQA
jgi:hypothetical protein